MGSVKQLLRYSVKLGYFQSYPSPHLNDNYFWDSEHAIWDRDLCKFVNHKGEVRPQFSVNCPVGTTIPVAPHRVPTAVQAIVNRLNENNEFYETDFCIIIDGM